MNIKARISHIFILPPDREFSEIQNEFLLSKSVCEPKEAEITCFFQNETSVRWNPEERC